MTTTIFSRNEDIGKIAFLNWRIHEATDVLNLLNIADGFLMASIGLAQSCVQKNDDKRADILIFPILANAHHGIELYLKGIMWTANRLNNSNDKINGSHNLKQLFQVVSAKVKLFAGRNGHKEFLVKNKLLQEYINNLFTKIGATDKNDKMDFSRYPFTKDYENHFYVKSANVEIDLEKLIDQFSLINRNLQSTAESYYYFENG